MPSFRSCSFPWGSLHLPPFLRSSSSSSRTLNGPGAGVASRTRGQACARHPARHRDVCDASVRPWFRLILRASRGACGAETSSLPAHAFTHARQSGTAAPEPARRHLKLLFYPVFFLSLFLFESIHMWHRHSSSLRRSCWWRRTRTLIHVGLLVQLAVLETVSPGLSVPSVCLFLPVLLGRFCWSTFSPRVNRILLDA